METDLTIPDIYADNLSVTVSPVGITMTLVRSFHDVDRATAEVTDVEMRVVGRVRLSRQLAAQLVNILQQGLGATGAMPTQPPAKGTKN